MFDEEGNYFLGHFSLVLSKDFHQVAVKIYLQKKLAEPVS